MAELLINQVTAVISEAEERIIRQVQSSRATSQEKPSNLAALHLHKKIGFKMMGVRKDYYMNPPEDAFVLGLHIGA